MPQEDAPIEPRSAGNSMPDIPANDIPPIERWNQQAWPPITFGVPAGWTDVPPDRFAWLSQERRIPPTAPILQQSHILAAVERAGTGGLAQVQLRLSDNAGLASLALVRIAIPTGRHARDSIVRSPTRMVVAAAYAVLRTSSERLWTSGESPLQAFIHDSLFDGLLGAV